MRLAAVYSFNGGEEAVTKKYPHLLVEVNAAIKSVNPAEHKTKTSKEKTMTGKLLYSPPSLNEAFKGSFSRQGWHPVRVKCDYPTGYYVGGWHRGLNKFPILCIRIRHYDVVP